MNVSKEININLNFNIWKTDLKNTVLTYDIALIIAHKVSWLKLLEPSLGSKDKKSLKVHMQCNICKRSYI